MTDGFVVSVCGFGVVWFLRKIRPSQIWVELSWVVVKKVGENNGQLRFRPPP